MSGQEFHRWRWSIAGHVDRGTLNLSPSTLPTPTTRDPRPVAVEHHVAPRPSGRVHRDRACIPRSRDGLALGAATQSDASQDTGNKVARKATLVGTQNIMLGGKTVIQPEVMIRGDLTRTQAAAPSGAAPANSTAVAIGRYCFLSKGCLLRPPGRMNKGYVELSDSLSSRQIYPATLRRLRAMMFWGCLRCECKYLG